MFAFRKPAWWLIAVLLAAEICFVAAAQWQWQRGVFKDQRAREFAAALRERDAAPRRNFNALLASTADFSAARLRGRLLLEHIVTLDNRIVQGQYGVDVFVPLALEGGGHVLVNLGWIAADRSRRVAPQLPAIAPEFEASGLMAPAPSAGLSSQVPIERDSRTPQMLLAIVPHDIAAALQLSPMLGRVFLPAAESASPFHRDWQPSGMSADRHRGYALQWASFAVACLILFAIFHVRRKEKSR